MERMPNLPNRAFLRVVNNFVVRPFAASADVVSKCPGGTPRDLSWQIRKKLQEGSSDDPFVSGSSILRSTSQRD